MKYFGFLCQKTGLKELDKMLWLSKAGFLKRFNDAQTVSHELFPDFSDHARNFPLYLINKFKEDCDDDEDDTFVCVGDSM